MPAPASWTRQAAQAKTGGQSSAMIHSAQGRLPSGCCQRSPRMNRSWSAPSSGSTRDAVTAWKPVSQLASHGNSHLSGMIRTSFASTFPAQAGS